MFFFGRIKRIKNLFLDFLSGEGINAFFMNGGDSTLDSYRRRASGEDEEPLIPEKHRTFLQSLQPWVELEDYYVVHAGFRPGVDIEDQKIKDLTWIREPFLYSDYDFGKRVIFGHTPFYQPIVTSNKIGLDTGAVYGNRLTCLQLPQMKFHSVEG